MNNIKIDVVIPVFNEAKAVSKVIGEIPKDLVRHIIICDNGSTDDTAVTASTMGAVVVYEPIKGYGNACLKGLEYIKTLDELPDIVVFLDGDYSDYPIEMYQIVNPIIYDGYDLVIGSRALGEMERGAMMPQQLFGNWLATSLIKLFYKYQFTDLGPFRGVRYEALQLINMQDRTFGWTVEMQVKAAKLKMKTKEVAVNYRRRIGTSKVSGTVKGTILAGHKILWTIFKYM